MLEGLTVCFTTMDKRTEGSTAEDGYDQSLDSIDIPMAYLMVPKIADSILLNGLSSLTRF